jgi:hypothetical protein
MRRSLPIVLSCIGIVLAANARAAALTTSGNEVFCRKKSDLPIYLAATRAKQLSDQKVEGCMQLRKGKRYEVLNEDRESHIIQVHLFGHHGPMDGYILRQDD